MVLACSMGNLFPLLVLMIGAPSVVLATMTSGVLALAMSDRRAWLSVPLFTVMWGFGILRILT